MSPTKEDRKTVRGIALELFSLAKAIRERKGHLPDQPESWLDNFSDHIKAIAREIETSKDCPLILREKVMALPEPDEVFWYARNAFLVNFHLQCQKYRTGPYQEKTSFTSK